MYYIVGVYLGDGYITYANRGYIIGLTAKSEMFINEFNNALENIGLKARKDKAGKYHRVIGYSKLLHHFLENFDIKKINKINLKHLISLIKGFYESEGSNGVGRGLRFYNTNRELLEQIKIGLLRIKIDSHYFKSQYPLGKKPMHILYIPAFFKKEFMICINPKIKF